MNVSAIKVHQCQCNHTLIFVQSPAPKVIQEACHKNSDVMTVIELGPDRTECPRCGAIYILPPAEVFDPERHALVRWLLDEFNDAE